jgi:hypothetical protein
MPSGNAGEIGTRPSEPIEMFAQAVPTSTTTVRRARPTIGSDSGQRVQLRHRQLHRSPARSAISEKPTSTGLGGASGITGAVSSIVSFSQTLESWAGPPDHESCLPRHPVWSTPR